ncbi:MAG TPA: hypothetical protein VGW78_03525 [Candidatus Babeliales bacterium]|nr:hypothetical protein [Candidatus Babeliales bacterium]
MNYFQIGSLATILSTITYSAAMEQNDQFFLNSTIATALIGGVNNYLRDYVSIPGYRTSHPIVYALQQMNDFMGTEDSEDPSQKVLKIARHDTVKRSIALIYDEYHQDPTYKSALADALASTNKDATSKGQAWSRVGRTSCLCIGNSIAAHSSYRCPTSYNTDYHAHLQEILRLSNDADPKDAGVYIAGLYTLFVAMQERLALMNE